MAARAPTPQYWPPRKEIRANWRDDLDKAPWQAAGALQTRTVARSTSQDQFMGHMSANALRRQPNFKPPPGGAETLWHMENAPPWPMSTSKSVFTGHQTGMPKRFRAPIGTSPYASADVHTAVPKSTSSDAFPELTFRPAPPQSCPPPVNPPLFSSADAQPGVVMRSNSTDSFQPRAGVRLPSCKPSSSHRAPFTSAEDTTEHLPRSTSKDAFQYNAFHAPPRRFRPKPRGYALV